MATKNIFSGASIRTSFVYIVYEELMKRDFVTYVDVLSKYLDNNKLNFNKVVLVEGKGYAQLRKAFPEVVQAIESIYPGSIIDNGKKGKAKRSNILELAMIPWLQNDRR